MSDDRRGVISEQQNNETAEQPKKKGFKKGLFYALFILLCVGSIVLTAFLDFGTDKENIPFSEVIVTMGDNIVYVLYAFICFLLVLFFKGLKRDILLNASLKKRNNLFLGIKSGTICKYYDAITPFGSGGQPMEIMYLKKHGVPTSVASGVTVVSYAIGLISSVFLAIIMIIVCGFENVNTYAKVLAIIGIVLNILLPSMIIIFSAMPNVGEAIARWVTKVGLKLRFIRDKERFETRAIDTMRGYAKSIRFYFGTYFFKTLLAFLCGFAYNIALYSIPYFLIRAFGISASDISYFKVLELCLICFLAVTAIPTPGNSGAAEISFYAIFSSFLLGGQLFWCVVLWRVLTYYMFILAGALLTLFGKLFHKNKHITDGEILDADHLGEAARAGESAIVPDTISANPTVNENSGYNTENGNFSDSEGEKNEDK